MLGINLKTPGLVDGRVIIQPVCTSMALPISYHLCLFFFFFVVRAYTVPSEYFG